VHLLDLQSRSISYEAENATQEVVSEKCLVGVPGLRLLSSRHAYWICWLGSWNLKSPFTSLPLQSTPISLKRIDKSTSLSLKSWSSLFLQWFWLHLLFFSSSFIMNLITNLPFLFALFYPFSVNNLSYRWLKWALFLVCICHVYRTFLVSYSSFVFLGLLALLVSFRAFSLFYYAVVV